MDPPRMEESLSRFELASQHYDPMAQTEQWDCYNHVLAGVSPSPIRVQRRYHWYSFAYTIQYLVPSVAVSLYRASITLHRRLRPVLYDRGASCLDLSVYRRSDKIELDV